MFNIPNSFSVKADRNQASCIALGSAEFKSPPSHTAMPTDSPQFQIRLSLKSYCQLQMRCKVQLHRQAHDKGCWLLLNQELQIPKVSLGTRQQSHIHHHL